MIQIIVDLYPDEKAFYPHVASPELSRNSPETYLKQAEWENAMRMMQRLSKHLRRVGFEDKRYALHGEMH